VLVEYRPEVTPKTTWKQDGDGLHVTAYRAQRLYTDRRWPNPVVLKITNIERGLTPPEVITTSVTSTRTGATLSARLAQLGNVPQVEVGFQYREKKGGTDLSEKTEPWTDLPGVVQTKLGEYSYNLTGLAPDRPYEFRARVKHPLITTYGQEKAFRTGR
jgi:alpha-L-fucosidase